jgi:hypothetical protein
LSPFPILQAATPEQVKSGKCLSKLQNSSGDTFEGVTKLYTKLQTSDEIRKALGYSLLQRLQDTGKGGWSKIAN